MRRVLDAVIRDPTFWHSYQLTLDPAINLSPLERFHLGERIELEERCRFYSACELFDANMELRHFG
jgi:hypothetical protein